MWGEGRGEGRGGEAVASVAGVVTQKKGEEILLISRMKKKRKMHNKIPHKKYLYSKIKKKV